MSEKIEYTGKDVAEAIENACRELGVGQEELKIEVLAAGSAGIFGLIGKKKAVIAVSLKKSRRPEKGRREEKPRREEPVRREAPAQARGPEGGKSGRPRKGEKRKGAAEPRRAPEKPPAQITPELLAAIKGDLEKILQLMTFPVLVEINNEGHKIVAKLSGDNEEELIGPEGQTLDSLQYLMRKIICRRVEGKVLFSLDIGSYREVRREDLEEMAQRLADEVRETGRTRSIPALNPAERRIVHMKLQDDPTIRSRSVGDGHFKKFLIYEQGRGQ